MRSNLSFSSPWVHLKNMSSIYLSQVSGCNCYVKKSGLHFIHENRSVRWCKFNSNSCSWYLPANVFINSKQLFLRINSATEIISLLGTLQMPISLSLFLKGALSGLRQFLGTQSPLKRWKMLFISPRKLFPFSRYLNFCLDFLVMYRNALIKKIRLISNFMTSQPG